MADNVEFDAKKKDFDSHKLEGAARRYSRDEDGANADFELSIMKRCQVIYKRGVRAWQCCREEGHTGNHKALPKAKPTAQFTAERDARLLLVAYQMLEALKKLLPLVQDDNHYYGLAVEAIKAAEREL